MAKLVRDIMISKVRVVEANVTVQNVAQQMQQYNIGAVVIVSAIGDGIGIFTERDLLTRVVAKGLDPKKTLMSDVMTPNFVCVQLNDELRPLAKLMLENNFRHLPAVDGRKVVGMLSIRDLLAWLDGVAPKA